jgi:hypothetical protein
MAMDEFRFDRMDYICQSLGLTWSLIRCLQLVNIYKIGKKVTFQHTIFLLLHELCIFLGALVVFSFQFCLVLFAAINGWTPINSFWRSCLAFHLPRTLCFSLLSFNECSLFLELRLAFVFRLYLCSDLVISLYKGVFWPLVHVGFHQKSYFKKVSMVLEKRKSFMQKKVVQKGACLDCGLGFCMSCLMSFW